MDSNKMDSDIISAAILTAAYINAQRQALTQGVVDRSIREMFPEFLAFVREQSKQAKPASGPAKGKK